MVSPELGAEGVGGPALEPANAAGRRARQDDARLPGLAQDLVDAVHLPHRDHVGHRAPADEDDVLRQQEVLGIGDVRHREQRKVPDLGGGVSEPVVEPEVVGGVVADGLVQYAQPGRGLAAQLDRVLNVKGDRLARQHHAAPDRDHVSPSVCRHAVTLSMIAYHRKRFMDRSESLLTVPKI